MKIIVRLFCMAMVMFSFQANSQSPQSFQYQSVVRDGNGSVVANQQVSFQMSIYSGSATGTLEYSETHSLTTNDFGLAVFAVGAGTVVSGDFTTINWGAASHFLKVEADIAGGTNYVDMGTVQLISVPYALHAKTSGDAFSGNYNDLTGVPTDVSTFNNDAGYIATEVDGDVTNELQIISISNDTIYLSNGGHAKLPAGFSGNYSDLNGAPVNVSQFANDAGYVTTSVDADADPANEIQILSLSGNDLTISDGNTVALPQYTYTSGSGISISGMVITNTTPDQTVTITGSGATTVTGTYPDFIVSSTDNNTAYSAGSGLNLTGTTFSNSAPDQTVTLIGNGATTVTGTYPNFTVSGTDNVNDADADPANELQTLSLTGNTLGLTGGGSVSLSNYIDTLWKSNGTRIYNSNTGNVGVGLNNPVGKMVVQGDALLTDSDPLFEVKDRTGATVFVVYPDSVRIFVGDDGSKTNKGTFAVSGRNTAKAFTHNYLLIRPDSSRVYTSNETKGFGVQNIGATTTTSYMQLTPNNYFIGHESGKSITSGLYNSFMGYQAGRSDTSGSSNVFIGYQCGFSNTSGKNNTGIGYQSLFSNTTGELSVAIGHESGYANVGGSYFTAVGYRALYHNTTGLNNTAVGYSAGYNTSTGNNNTTIGASSFAANTTGYANAAVGAGAMHGNTQAGCNTSMGYESLYFNPLGLDNTAFGFHAGFGVYGINFTQCNFIGSSSYLTVARTNVTMLGYGIANAQCTGNNQLLLGNTAITQIRSQVTGITAYSDKRFKTNVADNVAGLDFIMKLKPVTYNEDPTQLHKIWGTPDSLVRKIDHSEIQKQRFIGFLAQDVEVAAKECGFDFPGIDVPKNENEVYSLRYGDFIMPVVKAVQEQQLEIGALKSENEELKKNNQLQQNDINNLKAEIEKIKKDLSDNK